MSFSGQVCAENCQTTSGFDENFWDCCVACAADFDGWDKTARETFLRRLMFYNELIFYATGASSCYKRFVKH